MALKERRRMPVGPLVTDYLVDKEATTEEKQERDQGRGAGKRKRGGASKFAENQPFKYLKGT